MQKKLIEINGCKYMSTPTAADLWDMKSKDVARACRENRVIGAFKDSSSKWLIPVNTKKPLSMEYIRRLLIGLLRIKNRPELMDVCNSISDAEEVYGYLSDIGFVEMPDELSKESIREMALTDEGMIIATEGGKTGIDWNNPVLILGLIADVMSIWQTIKPFQ